MLDVDAVRAWCEEALEALGHAREEIDALNVYPVPDGDTGTNLYLTLEAAGEALGELGPDPGASLSDALRAMVHGALLGARGNSGVILSELGRGAAGALGAGRPDASGADRAAAALAAAADAAYGAVARPVEGTILSVARAAADAAHSARGAGLAAGEVVRAAAAAAHVALDRTPEQLEQLRRAGVVDAGGRGLTVLLDTLVASVTGEHPVRPTRRVALPQPVLPVPGDPGDGETPPAAQYEVMYLLDADAAAVAPLKVALAAVGDSLLVVGGEGLWNVHVHVDDVGAAVEAGVRAGRPYRIRVTHLLDRRRPAPAPGEAPGRAVVALLPDGGVAEVARAAGAVVVPSQAGRRPATRDVVEAVQLAHAGEVVVLPDARDTHAVAEAAAQWARAGGLRVAVVPTRACVQVLAALAVHDNGRRFDDDVVSMTSAARATRAGAVAYAVREALTSAGVCRPGDVLGLIDDDVVEIGSDLVDVATAVLDRLLSVGGELVTVVLGRDGVDAGRAVAARLRRGRPDVEVTVHDGGQEQVALLLGVE